MWGLWARCEHIAGAFLALVSATWPIKDYLKARAGVSGFHTPRHPCEVPEQVGEYFARDTWFWPLARPMRSSEFSLVALTALPPRRARLSNPEASCQGARRFPQGEALGLGLEPESHRWLGSVSLVGGHGRGCEHRRLRRRRHSGAVGRSLSPGDALPLAAYRLGPTLGARTP